MARTRSPVEEKRIGVASGRLRWTPDGEDLVTGPYRIQFQGPSEWKLVYRGRLLEVHTRRSKALAWAERHHRERQRLGEIARWMMAAGIALMAAILTVAHTSELLGFVVFVVVVWGFLSALARALASVTRNLLDPYRTREKWEPSDWWNHNP